ncbi:hypothetical protein TNCV_4854691 [Trichonephila clavipes]|nr:hypothetical protein TNCV_4854691 [Trichonephila clavipes]
MSSGRSLPQFNLGVQGGIQGDSHSCSEKQHGAYCPVTTGERYTQLKLKLSGTTAHESQCLLCSSQYTLPLGAEVLGQISRSGGQSEARPQCLSLQEILVLIYRSTAVRMKD